MISRVLTLALEDLLSQVHKYIHHLKYKYKNFIFAFLYIFCCIRITKAS